MKRFVLSVAATFVLAFAAIASAAVVQNEIIVFQQPVFSQCTGEFVDVTVTAHLMVIIQATGRGELNKLQSQLHASGTGQDSGTPYLWMDHTTSSAFVTGAFPLNQTYFVRERMVSTDGSPNSFTDVLLHVTLNANGDITAQIDSVDFGCH